MDRDEILALLNNRDLKDAHPNRRPKKAASLIVTRHSGDDTLLLMGKRSRSLAFMPGKYVFPGGGMERADSHLKPAQQLADREQKLLGANGRGLAMAAIRECFEETGLRVAARPASPSRSPYWRDYTSIGARPDLSRLTFIARAITPPRRIRRFDTFFFWYQADDHRAELSPGTSPSREISELSWFPLKQAVRLDIAIMTRAIIEGFKDEVLSPGQPKPFYRVVQGKFIGTDIK